MSLGLSYSFLAMLQSLCLRLKPRTISHRLCRRCVVFCVSCMSWPRSPVELLVVVVVVVVVVVFVVVIVVILFLHAVFVLSSFTGPY